MPLTVGSRLGHYDVTALIGEGGMGQVYEARDIRVCGGQVSCLAQKQVADALECL